MALIKCPECGSEVSSTAFDCPKCGKQLKKPKRGFFGKIFLWLFYLFNAFMCWGLIKGLSNVADMPAPDTEAAQVGAAIGTGLGVTAILGIWVIGAVITGLLALMTRPKR